MPSEKSELLEPMQPWPSLADFGKYTHLPEQALNLFYFEAGEAHAMTLVMLHGLGDEADTWRYVLLPLAEQFHTLALDLPGFGRSDQPDVRYDPNFMIGCIQEFIKLHAKSKPILMGSSLGGIFAHGLALTYPERVLGLILVGGALLLEKQKKALSYGLMQIPCIGEWLYTRLRKNPDAAFGSLNSVYNQLETLPAVDQEFLYTRVNQRVWSDGQRRAYFSTLRNLIPWVRKKQKTIYKDLASLHVPTLILRGENDTLLNQSSADAIVKHQPEATSAIIPSVGHLPHQEDPEGFLEITMAWLNENIK
jgi:pimeloyl-ACP methyl ester carboxylesterase